MGEWGMGAAGTRSLNASEGCCDGGIRQKHSARKRCIHDPSIRLTVRNRSPRYRRSIAIDRSHNSTDPSRDRLLRMAGAGGCLEGEQNYWKRPLQSPNVQSGLTSIEIIIGIPGRPVASIATECSLKYFSVSCLSGECV